MSSNSDIHLLLGIHEGTGWSPGQEEGEAHTFTTCKTCGLYGKRQGTEDQRPGPGSQLLLSSVLTLGCILLSGDLSSTSGK